MASRPEAPERSLQIPPGLVQRVAKSGFFDPKVRAWARSTVRAEDKLDVRLVPIYAAALSKAERARNLAHEIDPTDAVPLDFIEEYGAFATAEHQWVVAESDVTGELRGDMRLLARTVAAHERFIADARAGMFVSTQEQENAAATRLDPLLRELQRAQQRG